MASMPSSSSLDSKDRAINSCSAASKPSAPTSKPYLGSTSRKATAQSSCRPSRSSAASGPPCSRSSSKSWSWKEGALSAARSSSCRACAASTCSEVPSALASPKAPPRTASSSKTSNSSMRKCTLSSLSSLASLAPQSSASSAVLLASVLPASQSGSWVSEAPTDMERRASNSSVAFHPRCPEFPWFQLMSKSGSWVSEVPGSSEQQSAAQQGRSPPAILLPMICCRVREAALASLHGLRSIRRTGALSGAARAFMAGIDRPRRRDGTRYTVI
mmetsp:Transcript_104801/g.313093  ORF Transcript_104801/g.313093 Transcript_104801/m.313093 type:complete len:273 (-) Transcript_104801:2-820(-)